MQGSYLVLLAVAVADQELLSQKFGCTLKYAKAHALRDQVDVDMWTLVLLFNGSWPSHTPM